MKSKLLFPVVMYLERQVVIHDENSFCTVGMRFHSSTQFSTLKNLKRKAYNGWLLDYDGALYLFTNPVTSREWASTFSWLWNVVRTNYDVAKQEEVTTGLILGLLHGKPKSALDKDLRRFLSEFEEDTLVTQKLLDQWPI